MIISSYFTWLIVFVFLPTLALLLKFWRIYQRYPRTLLALVVFCFLLGFPWDLLAVKMGVWSFGREQMMGLWLDGLPLEEIIFLVSVPFLGGLIGLAILKVVVKK
ncbi:hypothetical protein A2155_02510 [candidate division WWE3 bacterium RBG_16_52_45]|nr:MAG: hypothetical protein A2155_02510 [candidate division WWE3 bacterium RBG_16_52_45]